eukprot:413105-Prorocentrum_minimum.AAC.1
MVRTRAPATQTPHRSLRSPATSTCPLTTDQWERAESAPRMRPRVRLRVEVEHSVAYVRVKP